MFEVYHSGFLLSLSSFFAAWFLASSYHGHKGVSKDRDRDNTQKTTQGIFINVGLYQQRLTLGFTGNLSFLFQRVMCLIF